MERQAGLLPEVGLLSVVLKSFNLPLFQNTSVFKGYYSYYRYLKIYRQTNVKVV